LTGYDLAGTAGRRVAIPDRAGTLANARIGAMTRFDNSVLPWFREDDQPQFQSGSSRVEEATCFGSVCSMPSTVSASGELQTVAEFGRR
jgi:hypothetical protein